MDFENSAGYPRRDRIRSGALRRSVSVRSARFDWGVFHRVENEMNARFVARIVTPDVLEYDKAYKPFEITADITKAAQLIMHKKFRAARSVLEHIFPDRNTSNHLFLEIKAVLRSRAAIK